MIVVKNPMGVVKFKPTTDSIREKDAWNLFACKRLLMAVLERALLDIGAKSRPYQSNRKGPISNSSANLNARFHKDKLTVTRARSALGWILNSSPNPKHITSYQFICHLFGFDPELLRKEKIRNKAIEYLRNHHQD